MSQKRSIKYMSELACRIHSLTQLLEADLAKGLALTTEDGPSFIAGFVEATMEPIHRVTAEISAQVMRREDQEATHQVRKETSE